MNGNISVEEYILNSGQWQQALNMLREIMLALDMEEAVKWGTPVYSVKGKNVVGIASFKSYTGLWFYQGVFLLDEEKRLYNAGDGRPNAMRQWRFISADDIEDSLDDIVKYIREAINNSLEGKVMKYEANKAFTIPIELKDAFSEDKNLKLNYDNLSHSKRRDYARYIDQAKKAETRIKRVNKCIPLIREGKGLMDIYKG